MGGYGGWVTCMVTMLTLSRVSLILSYLVCLFNNNKKKKKKI
jgi:hypothetical protein